MIQNIGYVFTVIVACAALLTVGIDVSSWQYWVVLGCLCVANICGYLYGVREKNAE